jgi:integrase
MSARKFRTTWWIDFRHEGQRLRMRSPHNSRAGAQAYEALLRGRLVRGEPLVAPKQATTQSFSAFLQEFYVTHVVTNNKISTQRSTKAIMDNHLTGFFAKKALDAISTEDVERFKAAKLEAGLSPKSVNNTLAVLSKALKTAIEWGRITSAPRIRLLKVPPQGFDFLDQDEARRLIAGFVDPRWRTMALCAVRTGLRMGELLGLRWEDIDFERRQLSVRRSIVRGVTASPKSNRVRFIPIADDLFDALAELRPKSGYVFQQANGEPMTRGMAWRAIQSACKRSGTRLVGLHVLRHSFASQLASAGVSIQVIQTLLGHSDMKMTLRYSHLMPSTLRDAISVLQTTTEKSGQLTGNRAEMAPQTPTGNTELLQTLLR